MQPLLLVLTSLDPMTVTAMPQEQFLKDHSLNDLIGGIQDNNVTVMIQQFGDQNNVDKLKRIIQESVKVGYDINQETTFDYLSITNPPGMFGHQQN